MLNLVFETQCQEGFHLTFKKNLFYFFYVPLQRLYRDPLQSMSPLLGLHKHCMRKSFTFVLLPLLNSNFICKIGWGLKYLASFSISSHAAVLCYHSVCNIYYCCMPVRQPSNRLQIFIYTHMPNTYMPVDQVESNA